MEKIIVAKLGSKANVDYRLFENAKAKLFTARHNVHNYHALNKQLSKYKEKVNLFLTTGLLEHFSGLPLLLQIPLIDITLKNSFGKHLFHGDAKNHKTKSPALREQHLGNALRDLSLIYGWLKNGIDIATKDLGIVLYCQTLQAFSRNPNKLNDYVLSFCQQHSVLGYFKRVVTHKSSNVPVIEIVQSSLLHRATFFEFLTTSFIVEKRR